MVHALLRAVRLLALPALAMSLFAASAPAQTAANRPTDSVAAKTDSGPRFRGGDMTAFRRWVVGQLDFPADRYTAGERIRLMVQFALTKKGKTKEVELRKASDYPVDQKVVAIVEKSDGWTPGTASHLIPGAKHLLLLDLMLHENPDGTLRAEDHSVYGKADTVPRFEGRGPRAFREWIARHVTLHMPQAEGAVTARFVIEKDGSMSELKVSGKKGENTLAGRVKDAIAAAPRWTPAVEQGEAVRFGCSMKLHFGQAAAEAAADTTRRGDDDAYLLAETMPRFKGGNLNDFRRWVFTELTYPPEAVMGRIAGRVIVTFIIEKDGSISHITVRESPHNLLSDAVVGVISRSPKWKPGEQGGDIVRVKYTLPVDFSLRDGNPVPFGSGYRPRSGSRYKR